MRELEELLKKFHQTHLIEKTLSFSKEEKQKLYLQLKKYPQNIDHLQKPSLDRSLFQEEIKPLQTIAYSWQEKSNASKVISDGKLGCLITAGGQGSRLGFSKPKGLFPISSVCKKSLFQICFEKIYFAKKKYKTKILVAILLSKSTQDQTIDYLKKNNFFGLKSDQVFFFFQDSFPFFDKEGRWFLDKHQIVEGPAGNGDVFFQFYQSKIFHHFKKQKVSYLNLISIDNPLADPIDEKGLHFHIRKNHEVTIKCIKKKAKQNSLGVLVQSNNKIKILEYTFLHLLKTKNPYMFGNTGMYIVNMDWIEKIAKKRDLPVYSVLKKMPTKDASFAYKCEKYLFDVFCYAKNIGALCYPQKQSFAPLKDEKSIAKVQRALICYDRYILEKYFQKKSKKIFEISFDFHYPTSKLLKKWKKKTIPDDFFLQG